MLDKIETLEEVERKTSEEIGKFKPLNEGGVYNPKKVKGFSLRNYKIGMEVADKEKGKRAKGYFKSGQGYNSKYKNTKKHANHYGEYIAYIILQQLGKKACRVDLKRMAMKHPYSDKILQIEGVVSYLQKEENEVIIPARVIIERYKGTKITDKEFSNVELILETFEDMFKEIGQEDKISQMRKDFFDMCAFDLKFANRDRNEDNLALKLNPNLEKLSFYDLFDNEQILGMQENRVDVKRYLESDKEFEKFKAKELTSYIGTPQKSQKVQAKELLKYLLQHYPQEILSSLDDMSRYHLSDLEELMDCCEGLSDEHKSFAKKVFLDREKEIAQTIKEYKEQEKKTIEPR